MFATQARPLWRQALFLAFATRAIEDPSDFLRRFNVDLQQHREADFAALADLLPVLSPAEIVSAVSGVASAGMVGVLRRLGDTPVRPETYRQLAEWHASEPADPRASLLLRMVSVDQGRIDALDVLDPVFWISAALPFITSRGSAEELNSSLAYIRDHCSTATTEALRDSAAALSGEKTIAKWVIDWLRQADQFKRPLQADDVLRPAANAKDLIDLGQRFGNCLGSHCLAAVISGKLTVIEYLPEPAVAILVRLDHDNWLLAGIYVAKNRRVPHHLREVVEKAVQGRSSNVRIVVQPERAERDMLRKYLPWFDPTEMQFDPFEF